MGRSYGVGSHLKVLYNVAQLGSAHLFPQLSQDASRVDLVYIVPNKLRLLATRVEVQRAF